MPNVQEFPGEPISIKHRKQLEELQHLKAVEKITVTDNWLKNNAQLDQRIIAINEIRQRYGTGNNNG